MIRLQTYIARCGIASRRKAEKLIENGSVTVNGKIVKKQGTLINPLKDEVEVEVDVLSLFILQQTCQELTF